MIHFEVKAYWVKCKVTWPGKKNLEAHLQYHTGMKASYAETQNLIEIHVLTTS